MAEGSIVKVQETPGMTQGSKITTRDIKDIVRLTPVEQRMVDLLSDGYWHTQGELRGCLDDELAESKDVIGVHIFNLRDKLRPIGQDVTCETWYRRAYYRHVILLCGPMNGHPSDKLKGKSRD